MHRQQQHVIFRIKLEEPGAQDRPRRQIERLHRLVTRPLARRLQSLVLIETAEIFNRHRDVQRRGDSLHRSFIQLLERRTQCLMPLDHRSQAPLQRVDVELTSETQGDRHVVCGARAKLIQEPESLLGE